MQMSGLYASPSPHPLYTPYHPVLPGPQDHELKKQYLSLLPPQQIIDICLNFDLHVPPYVKSTIWPPDINAAIAAIQKTSTPAVETPAASSSTTNGEKSVMNALTEPSEPSSTIEQSIEKPAEVQPPEQPPDKPPSPPPDTPTPAQPPAQTSTASTEQATPASAASAPAAPSAAPPQQPPYPHQPYGYGHPQAAYPHTPYYQTPPGYPPYPSPYPYPHHLPGQYPQPHPTYPQSNTVPYAPPPHPTHPHAPPQTHDVFHANPASSADDLPSYEEMIAEALGDSADPEGCAPKDLFNWMATRYPLQQNFRPSASQALQKAFKRGRFLKSSNGKYKLNTTWEGGATSRRTTRRPQTQNPSSASPVPASPFTHAPLVHHNQPSQTPTFQTQSFSYPYQQQAGQGFSSFTQPAQPGQTQTTPAASTSAPTITTTTAPSDASQATTSAQDAWEAAQNILKAINFDTLLSLPKEDSDNVETSLVGPSTTIPPPGSLDVPSELDVPPTSADGSAPAGVVNATEDYSAGRAELQAHLALLAAQLAELSQEDEGDPVVHYPVITSTSVPPPPTPAPAPVAAAAPLTGFVTAPLVPPPIASFPPPTQSQPQAPYGMPMYPPPVDPGIAQQPVPSIPTMPVVLPPLQPMPAEEEEDSEDDDDMEAVIF